MQEICADLQAEYLDLRSILVTLEPDQWSTPTPAEGWDIRDQVCHLAYFDEKAVMAHEQPEAFAAEVAELMAGGQADALIEAQVAAGRSLSGAEALAWWDAAHRRLIEVYEPLDPKTRVVWYGPAMAAKSKITARIMETWAHGQDVADALGVPRPVTDRIRHVCHLGVRARAFAHMANELVPPEVDIHVSLTGPHGDVWEWGDPESGQRVEGAAIDFAMLVTQRRHRADTSLVATGPDADRWLDIAQAFAGRPGPGRRPGQFG